MSSSHEETLLLFRKEIIQLYNRFEADVKALCRKSNVKINCWYSPSDIPQPKFIIDGVGFDADEIYSEDKPKLLVNKMKRKTRKGRKRKTRGKNHPNIPFASHNVSLGRRVKRASKSR